MLAAATGAAVTSGRQKTNQGGQRYESSGGHQTILVLVGEWGSCVGFPSQWSSTASASGVDEAKRAAAEARVREWRQAGTLYMPDFPAETVSALDGTIRYPPIGSATMKAS